MSTPESLCWDYCLNRLKSELNHQQFNTFILPLQANFIEHNIQLFAPNRFVRDWINKNHLDLILKLITESGYKDIRLQFSIGSKDQEKTSPSIFYQPNIELNESKNSLAFTKANTASGLISHFTFDNFIEGKSNQMARAAASQISQHPGNVYNPLFIYGATGLGKTHLLHAIGNAILKRSPDAEILYMYANNFVQNMVQALQNNSINNFKKRFQSLNVLLIDDIQFFVGKENTQEEFFHTFNHLFESKQQIVLTSDKFPKEIHLEERLKSRFGWGLTVRVEPPDLETKVAILQRKSMDIYQTTLPDDVAFFISKRFQSSIRDLEGALNRIIANAKFTALPITIENCRKALKDMLAAQDKLISIESIQKHVSQYFGIKTADFFSSSRSRTIARPRQIAMCLARELTNSSMPEIGKAFGGRDHTTVLYAVKKVEELRVSNPKLEEDYNNLLRTLTN
jgi:chromosomal replication initiator protein